MLRHSREKKIAANLHVFLVLKTPAPIDTTRLTTRRSLARSAERETRWPKLARAATPCAARLPGLAGRRHVAATPQRPTGPHVRGTTPQSPLQVNFSGLGDGESTMPCLPPARAHPSQSLQKLNPRAIAATHLSPDPDRPPDIFSCPGVAVQQSPSTTTARTYASERAVFVCHRARPRRENSRDPIRSPGPESPNAGRKCTIAWLPFSAAHSPSMRRVAACMHGRLAVRAGRTRQLSSSTGRAACSCRVALRSFNKLLPIRAHNLWQKSFLSLISRGVLAKLY